MVAESAAQVELGIIAAMNRSYLCCLGVLLLVCAVDAQQRSTAVQETQARGYWIDPSTGLMWAGKDNGKDVSWGKAMKYCRTLHLASYSDWRLANMAELQGIFDRGANAPGLAGLRKKLRGFTWHVKGNLFLTGDQRSSNYRIDDRGRSNGYEYYFDFNEGKPNDQPSGFPYPSDGMRGLCVRGSEK
jgi:hypothetical protein